MHMNLLASGKVTKPPVKLLNLPEWLFSLPSQGELQIAVGLRPGSPEY